MQMVSLQRWCSVHIKATGIAYSLHYIARRSNTHCECMY